MNSPTNDTNPLGWQEGFTEGQLSFDIRNVTPLYESRFGLAYTTFEMSPSLAFRAVQENPDPSPDPSRAIKIEGHPELWGNVVEVSFTVSNTGTRPGKAVPQLYISFPLRAPKGTPIRSLRGFESILVQPGKTQSVRFVLKRRDVNY